MWKVTAACILAASVALPVMAQTPANHSSAALQAPATHDTSGNPTGNGYTSPSQRNSVMTDNGGMRASKIVFERDPQELSFTARHETLNSATESTCAQRLPVAATAPSSRSTGRLAQDPNRTAQRRHRSARRHHCCRALLWQQARHDGGSSLHDILLRLFARQGSLQLTLDWHHVERKCEETVSLALNNRHIRNNVLDQRFPLLWIGHVDPGMECRLRLP